MDINQLNIQKVANGYIVRDGVMRGDFTSKDLAVFNNVNDMCEWIKRNFTLPPGVKAVNALNTLCGQAEG